MVDIENQIREAVYDKVDLSFDISDEEIRSMIKAEIIGKSKEVPLSLGERRVIENHVYNSLRRLDVLEDLLEDEQITEIMINGPNDIFIEKNGSVMKSKEHFSSKEKLDDIVQSIVAKNNKIVNETNPIVDTRLKDGSRVNIVLTPVSYQFENFLKNR